MKPYTHNPVKLSIIIFNKFERKLLHSPKSRKRMSSFSMERSYKKSIRQKTKNELKIFA